MNKFNIDKTLYLDAFDIADVDDWATKPYDTFTNEDFIVDGLPPKSLEGQTIIIVNLSPIENKETLLKWLRDNSKFMCMNECNPYLERLHLIDINGGNDELVRSASTSDSELMTGEELMIKLGISSFLTKKNERYDKYIILDFTSGTLECSTSSIAEVILNEDISSYSLPFFQSLIECNNVQDFKKCTFKFAYIDIIMNDGSTQKTIAFMVRFDNNKTAYYDYSHNPAAARSIPNLAFNLESLKLISLF